MSTKQGKAAGKEEKKLITLRAALISMGYREVRAGKWIKPVGYQAFVVNEETRVWSNVFKAKTEEILVWERHKIEPNEDPLVALKERETWTRTDIYVEYVKSAFEFMTTEDLVMLGDFK